jgi:methanogenic corrinoid protein MtbC1
MSLKEELFAELRGAVLSGDPEEVVKLCKRVIEAGVDPLEAIEKALVAA